MGGMRLPFFFLLIGLSIVVVQPSSWRVLAASSESLESGSLEEHIEVPDFELELRDGRKLRLSEFRGQFVLLNFWHTRCPPCIYELPSMEELNHRLRAHPFSMLAVSVDPNWGMIDEFLARIGVRFSFAVLLDADQKVAAGLYGLEKYPETFFIDPSGRLLRHYIGGVDWRSEPVLAELEALMSSASKQN